MKPIKGYENYLISENGDIILNKTTGRKLTIAVDTSKYKRVNLYKNRQSKRCLVHRLVASTYIDNPDNFPQVNHKDGNKLNNHYENLEWITAGDNQRHAYNMGLKRYPKGELNGRNLLSEQDVIDIYNKLLEGCCLSELAREYNVGKSTIATLKVKDSWQYLLKDLPNIKTADYNEKLTETQVRLICRYYSEGKMPSEVLTLISGDFFVTKDQLSGIKRRRTFKTISKDYKW